MRILFLLFPLLLTACASDRLGIGGTGAPQVAQPVATPPAQGNLYGNPQADLVTNPPSSQPRGSGVQINPLPELSPGTKPAVSTPVSGATNTNLPNLPNGTTKIASANSLNNVPVAPVAPRPNLGPLGSWNVKDTEGSCRITLSSQAAFDLQRASSNCKGGSLSKINAWEKQGSTIILYEPGGKVAARLSEQGGNTFSGSTSKGADVTMSR